MSDDSFQSGPWVGFYNYGAGQARHRMDLHLDFSNGLLTGDGNDDVGRFHISGKYDTHSRECHWTKSYPGSHDVFYRGFGEGKGIWGTWEIGVLSHGGFHIWPRTSGEGEEETAAFAQPVDAISQETIAPRAPAPKIASRSRVLRRPTTSSNYRRGRKRL